MTTPLPIGTRVMIENDSGTIVFYGNNISTAQPASFFYGIDWDNYTKRGKHNGLVNQTQKFHLELNSASFLHQKKVVGEKTDGQGIGKGLLHHVLERYTSFFEDNPQIRYPSTQTLSLLRQGAPLAQIHSILFPVEDYQGNVADEDDGSGAISKPQLLPHQITQNQQRLSAIQSIYLEQAAISHLVDSIEHALHWNGDTAMGCSGGQNQCKTNSPCGDYNADSVSPSLLPSSIQQQQHQQQQPHQPLTLAAFLPSVKDISLPYNLFTCPCVIGQLVDSFPKLAAIDLSGNPLSIPPHCTHHHHHFFPTTHASHPIGRWINQVDDSANAIDTTKVSSGSGGHYHHYNRYQAQLDSKLPCFETYLTYIQSRLVFRDPVTGLLHRILDIPNFPWFSFITHDDCVCVHNNNNNTNDANMTDDPTPPLSLPQCISFNTIALKSLSLSSIPMYVREKHHMVNFNRAEKLKTHQSECCCLLEKEKEDDRKQQHLNNPDFSHPYHNDFVPTSLYNTPWHWVLLLSAVGALDGLTTLELLNLNLRSLVEGVIVPVTDNISDENKNPSDGSCFDRNALGFHNNNNNNNNNTKPEQSPILNLIPVSPHFTLHHQQATSTVTKQPLFPPPTLPPTLFPNLTTMLLNENSLEWEAILPLSRLQRLESIELNDNIITAISHPFSPATMAPGSIGSSSTWSDIQHFANLRRLSVDNNPIPHIAALSGLKSLPSLQILSLIHHHRNQQQFIDRLNGGAREDKHLTNPAPTLPLTDAPLSQPYPFPNQFIRNIIILLFPQLIVLNHVEVNNHERKEAAVQAFSSMTEFLFGPIFDLLHSTIHGVTGANEDSKEGDILTLGVVDTNSDNNNNSNNKFNNSAEEGFLTTSFPTAVQFTLPQPTLLKAKQVISSTKPVTMLPSQCFVNDCAMMVPEQFPPSHQPSSSSSPSPQSSNSHRPNVLDSLVGMLQHRLTSTDSIFVMMDNDAASPTTLVLLNIFLQDVVTIMSTKNKTTTSNQSAPNASFIQHLILTRLFAGIITVEQITSFIQIPTVYSTHCREYYPAVIRPLFNTVKSRNATDHQNHEAAGEATTIGTFFGKTKHPIAEFLSTPSFGRDYEGIPEFLSQQREKMPGLFPHLETILPHNNSIAKLIAFASTGTSVTDISSPKIVVDGSDNYPVQSHPEADGGGIVQHIVINLADIIPSSVFDHFDMTQIYKILCAMSKLSQVEELDTSCGNNNAYRLPFALSYFPPHLAPFPLAVDIKRSSIDKEGNVEALNHLYVSIPVMGHKEHSLNDWNTIISTVLNTTLSALIRSLQLHLPSLDTEAMIANSLTSHFTHQFVMTHLTPVYCDDNDGDDGNSNDPGLDIGRRKNADGNNTTTQPQHLPDEPNDDGSSADQSLPPSLSTSLLQWFEDVISVIYRTTTIITPSHLVSCTPIHTQCHFALNHCNYLTTFIPFAPIPTLLYTANTTCNPIPHGGPINISTPSQIAEDLMIVTPGSAYKPNDPLSLLLPSGFINTHDDIIHVSVIPVDRRMNNNNNNNNHNNHLLAANNANNNNMNSLTILDSYGDLFAG